MRRRLPHESAQLLADLTSWIEWRYANSKERLVLTSAPTSLPAVLERGTTDAVWRLAWQESGAATLYGLTPSSPGKYFVLLHDPLNTQREGIFERLWSQISGDSLEPEAR